MDITTEQRTLLVVLAHPDDESLPMGGTLAKYATAGARVILACATRGEAGIPGLAPAETARVRTRELQAAAAALGLASVHFLGYRDGEVAAADPNAVVAQLVAILRTERPQVIITFGPDGISGHPDHVAIQRYTTLAFDQAALPDRLYFLAPFEATRQGCGVIPASEAAGGPVSAIAVADYLVAKVRATQCHASQKPSYPGSPEVEARRLVCHEYFTLARPATRDILAWTDLFHPPAAVQHHSEMQMI